MDSKNFYFFRKNTLPVLLRIPSKNDSHQNKVAIAKSFVISFKEPWNAYFSNYFFSFIASKTEARTDVRSRVIPSDKPS